MASYPTRKHRRLPDYDYRTAGFYFVTVCVQDRLRLLGRVVSGEMQLSAGGESVHDIMAEVPQRYPEVDLDVVVVMPDHVHAIVALHGETISLSTVMHGIKSHTTARYAAGVRGAGWPPFHGRLWQPGFYDRIIRDDRELTAIREYVAQNPFRWSLKEEGV